MRRRTAQFHGAPVVALGTGAGIGAARGGPGTRSGFRCSLSPAAPQRAHFARPFAVDGRALASCGPSRPQAHSGAVRTGAGHDGDYTRREGATGGHRPFRTASGARGGSAGGRGSLVPSGTAGAWAAVLPLRGNAGAAQESGDAVGGLAGSAAQSRGGPGAGRTAARRRSGNPARSRDCAWRAKCRMRNCRRYTRAHWHLSILRTTKASACRCWRRCSAARR